MAEADLSLSGAKSDMMMVLERRDTLSFAIVMKLLGSTAVSIRGASENVMVVTTNMAMMQTNVAAQAARHNTARP